MTRRAIPLLREMPTGTLYHGCPTCSVHAATVQAETYKHKDGTLVAVAPVGVREFDGAPLFAAVRYAGAPAQGGA